VRGKSVVRLVVLEVEAGKLSKYQTMMESEVEPGIGRLREIDSRREIKMATVMPAETGTTTEPAPRTRSQTGPEPMTDIRTETNNAIETETLHFCMGALCLRKREVARPREGEPRIASEYVTFSEIISLKDDEANSEPERDPAT